MPISIEARVWLATHLLYPNSTQAFDVYQAIVSQSEKAIRANDGAYLLYKLSQICEKIPSINSNLAFHVFENSPIDEWRLIYKKTQKIQQIIFLGVLIFELRPQQIAKIFKMHEDKVKFLFHQLFKKIVEQTPEIKKAYEFQFKKINDSKVSYLFINENLIDHTLGHLSAEDSQKVEQGLQSYPTLQASEVIYRRIAKQMNDLLDAHLSFSIEIPVSVAQVVPSAAPEKVTKLSRINRHKKPISISAISIVLLVVVFMRPRWIENFTDTSAHEALTLLEVNKASRGESEDDEQTPVSLNELPIQSKPAVAARLQTPPALPAGSGAEPASPNVVSKAVVVAAAPIPDKATAMTEAKKQGGLYRGFLVVTDLDEVSAKVRERIVSLGGKKAGEVELGWKKSDNLGYYHFTLPQDNVAAVNEYLAQFGKYKVEFENHPRLIPAGLKRFIIEVRQGD